MAHSSWTIPAGTEKKTQGSQLASRLQTSGKTASSFAAMMAREQNGTTKTEAAQQTADTVSKKVSNSKQAVSQSTPRVARLPDSAGLPLNNAVLAGRTPSDMLRMQNFSKAQTDLGQTRAMEGLMRNLAGDGTSLGLARSMGVAQNLRTIAASNNGRGFALNSTDFIHTRNSNNSGATARPGKSSGSRRRNTEEMGLGKLSAKFESGSDGIAAIGYDSTGGTSYGKYQIASKVGSMRSFLSFLDEEAPDLAKRLRNAGPANTGSRRGGMPDAWRAIASEQPERFEQLQEAFIHQSHYKPALEAIGQRTGIDTSNLSAAMREVIWSTAVQHGPAGAARIFARADDLSGKSQEASYERKLITNVYNVRAGQFGSSTSQVREAVRNRFRQERELALHMLEGDSRANRA